MNNSLKLITKKEYMHSTSESNRNVSSTLSHCVLFATLRHIMVGAALHQLFTQVAVMLLACPAEYMIVITNLLTKNNRELYEIK